MKKTLILATAFMTVSTFVSLALAETKDLTLKKFSKVKVYAPVDLDISVGQKQSFTMEGRDEDLEKLIVEVRDGSLIIKKEKRSGRMKNVVITLTMENLTQFIINGSSDAKIRDVDSKSFEVGINGSGDIIFDGKSDELDVEINGSGDVISKHFDTKQVSVEINGSGDIDLAGNCESLDVSINGSGDFSGKNLTCATVKASVSGSGDATVYASERIQVSTSGSSDLDVYGNPKSIKSRSSGNSDFTVHEGE